VKIEASELTAADGHRIFCRTLVPEKARAALLLLHGVGEHSGFFERAIDALAAAGVAVYAPDHRGHGHSGGLAGDVEGLEKLLDDAALVQLELQRAVPQRPLFVFGHSFGGQLAVLYALRHQQELAGLVLCAALVLVPSYISSGMVQLSRIIGRLLPRLPVQGFDYERTTRDPRAVELMRRDPLYYKGKIRAGTGAVMLAGMRQATRRLEELRLPLLILHGAKDETVELVCSRTIAERAASGDKTLRVYPDAMHHLILEPERDEVLKLIADWILARAH
jgi:alpha-beta hydrolase superfamily lysophospholipase